MGDVFWLERLKEAFASTSLDYEELYELIEAAIARKKIDFPAFIYEASKGIGFSVGEGHFYSLDQDWDDPEAFDEVSFFLGGMEVLSISVHDYVSLMKIAADVYSSSFPEEKDRVLVSAKRLEGRYLKFSEK
ncbi:hypothetical protein [Pseudomonas donghuensis]|uniref:hypothetical protein n=1 Tax=Pseudomonas donghuensis TaxID=1163398 RepID=UPI002E114A0F|nr:hypothetical protein VP780_18625 [Pseudomonas donghuensis]